MSLRPAKVGILKNGLKTFNNAGRNSYCTKTRPLEDDRVILIASGPQQRLSNEILGINSKFPFAGGISVDRLLLEEIQNKARSSKEDRLNPFGATLSQPVTPEGLLRHCISEITDILDSQMRVLTNSGFEQEDVLRVEVMKADRAMELKAMNCPKTLKKDLRRLFVDVEVDKFKDITVLNLTQKSVADMGAWSEEMEIERENLTEDFINIALAICFDLQKLGNGHWADFIEPSSGRPYFGKYTNVTLFETDDRYRDLGFQIEDLGCCKVVKHVKWSTRAFIGTIFTDAPLDSDEVKKILANSQSGQYFQEKSPVLDKE